jgi:hypothetical protein
MARRRRNLLIPLWLHRAILPLALLALLLNAGCDDGRDERIEKEIARYDAARRAREDAMPSQPGYSLAVTARTSLSLHMPLEKVNALLPRKPGDPAEIVSGGYRTAVRRLPGDKTVSLTFVNERLAVIGLRERLTADKASSYRAGLEKAYGPPHVEGAHLDWSLDSPPQTLRVFFETDEEAYTVNTMLIDDRAANNIREKGQIPPPP